MNQINPSVLENGLTPAWEQYVGINPSLAGNKQAQEDFEAGYDAVLTLIRAATEDFLPTE